MLRCAGLRSATLRYASLCYVPSDTARRDGSGSERPPAVFPPPRAAVRRGTCALIHGHHLPLVRVGEGAAGPPPGKAEGWSAQAGTAPRRPAHECCRLRRYSPNAADASRTTAMMTVVT